jgi:hypothetical protein
MRDRKIRRERNQLKSGQNCEYKKILPPAINAMVPRSRITKRRVRIFGVWRLERLKKRVMDCKVFWKCVFGICGNFWQKMWIFFIKGICGFLVNSFWTLWAFLVNSYCYLLAKNCYVFYLKIASVFIWKVWIFSNKNRVNFPIKNSVINACQK